MASVGNIIERLRKVLSLTTSPVEGEAQAAAEMLQKLLTDHNLSIADLEGRGQAAPGVREQRHDLGKAGFKYKLDLAEVIAKYYFCLPLIDRKAKTVAFVGRPDNIDALQMLYVWLIDQIKRISRKEYAIHGAPNHVDHLRWHVNFGEGAVIRLASRLGELDRRRKGDVSTTALMVHHESEISDYLEHIYGYRKDGRRTKEEQASHDRWEAAEAEWRNLRRDNPEEYYRRRPWERPATEEERRAEKERNDQWYAEYDKAEKRRQADRDRYHEKHGYSERSRSAKSERKDEHEDIAHRAGHRAADDINLQPFLKGGRSPKKEIK